MTSLRRSASSFSPRLVYPVTSANSIVTSLRSLAGAGSAVDCPQAGQNRAPSGSGAAQAPHAAANGVPQLGQNAACGAASAPHDEQVFTAVSVRATPPTVARGWVTRFWLILCMTAGP